jgi:predicted transglutaminase-like cysteine proteinase
MSSGRAYKFALTVVVLGLLAGTASAGPASPYMELGGKASQPIGHFEFCRTHSGECSMKSSGDVRVRLSAARWNELVNVNNAVNAAVTPVTDEAMFGKPEVWFYPADRGDCEDFVLLKRRELIARGWPVGALLITVARQRNGDGHAVLTVLTDRGDLVLDNLQPRVRLWSETDYQYVKRQSEYDTGRWVSIDDARTPTVGSLRN